eukprot:scaffold3166_cov399-Prasinococcus_capsulatus_cf.AAC.34
MSHQHPGGGVSSESMHGPCAQVDMEEIVSVRGDLPAWNSSRRCPDPGEKAPPVSGAVRTGRQEGCVAYPLPVLAGPRIPSDSL